MNAKQKVRIEIFVNIIGDQGFMKTLRSTLHYFARRIVLTKDGTFEFNTRIVFGNQQLLFNMKN